MNAFKEIDPIYQVLITTIFTWLMTCFGASAVFFLKNIKKSFLNTMYGFAAGVMIAASFWSLLSPAVKISEEIHRFPSIFVVGGFLVGAACIFFVDKLENKFRINKDTKNNRINRKSILLIIAITLHNIPEGLAIGVAYGVLNYNIASATFASATALAIGIAIQNFAEGAAVSLPLRENGVKPIRAFLLGQVSGMIEPFAGVLGALVVLSIKAILPFTLSLAAGAIIYVSIKELVPEAQENKNEYNGTIGIIIGFAVMTLLDIAI